VQFFYGGGMAESMRHLYGIHRNAYGTLKALYQFASDFR